MRILTFRGRTMQAAMARVREEAGSDAVVLSTGNGIGGQYEISVAVEDETTPQTRAASPLRPLHRTAPRPHPTATPTPEPNEDLSARLDRRLSLLENFVRLQIPVESEILRRLVASGVDAAVVREIAETCPSQDEAAALAHVQGELEKRISIAPAIHLHPNRPTLVCVVGPSGAGKTTTIAKLAAHYAVRLGRRVGIATQDTHRLGAVAQLEAFAKVLNVPVKPIVRPEDTADILQGFSDCELVLVDTAGVGDEDARIELRTALGAVQWDEIALVLPAVTSKPDMDRAANRYREFRPTRLVMTKLDEAALPGILMHASNLGTPIGHLADGPHVPHDLHDASTVAVVEAIFGATDHD